MLMQTQSGKYHLTKRVGDWMEDRGLVCRRDEVVPVVLVTKVGEGHRVLDVDCQFICVSRWRKLGGRREEGHLRTGEEVERWVSSSTGHQAWISQEEAGGREDLTQRPGLECQVLVELVSSLVIQH